ncbi:12159_t:CDS:2, partial [Cetraspora pellucida]
MKNSFENDSDTSQSSRTIKKQKKTNLQKIIVNKGECPKAPIWKEFDTGKSNSKGEVPNNIRQHWLIQ